MYISTNFELRPETSSLTAFLAFFQHGSLQMELLPVHERQLILIHEEEPNNYSTVLHVNPNHHPIIMLRKTQVDSTNILEEVACHDNRVVENNIFRTGSSEWTIKRNIVGSYPTERLVH